MYIFNPTKTYESTVLPGVKVSLRKLTEGRRLQFQIAVGPPLADMRALALEQRKLLEETPINQEKFAELNERIEFVATEKLTPAKIKWAVANIQGLQIGEEAATLDNLMDWPSDLVQELLKLVDDVTALNEVERGNSDSPTTSGPLTVGRDQNSSAQTASEADSSSPETAPATFLN